MAGAGRSWHTLPIATFKTREYGVLVGRTDELASLEHALDELDRGSSGAVALRGEPGIGKTRLLRELMVRGEQRECGGLAVRLDLPPDGVSAGAAGGEGRAVAERASMPLERGEHDAALLWFVTVLKEVAGHDASLPPFLRADIGGPP